MSQIWDVDLINPTTTSPLTDITRLTNALNALRTVFSGPSFVDAEAVPYMFWADTTEGILKRRSADNTTWVFALSLTDSFIKEINTTYTTLVTDAGNMLLVDASSTDITINLISASAARAGSVISIKKVDSTTNKVIVAPNGTETIDEDLDYQLQVAHETAIFRSDGENWRIVNLYRPLVILTKTAAYTVTDADDTAVINVNVATSTVTLPVITAVHNGFSVTIKKLIAGTTTIVPNGTTIDGLIANKTLTAVNQATTLMSNGAAWFTISEANVPITFPAQSYATAAQMKAETVGNIAVTPSVMKYSPRSIQMAIKFAGDNGIMSYNAGNSVANVTRINIGIYTINFGINNIPDTANYAVVASGEDTTPTATGMNVSISQYLTTSVTVRTYRLTQGTGAINSVTPADAANVTVIISALLP